MIEARDANALSRGMQGMSVRIARALNRLMKRRGTVFADRHHERILRSPKEVRYALHDTLNNAKKHGIGPRARGSVDALSSAPWFEGWSRAVRFDETRLPGADRRRRQRIHGLCVVDGARRRVAGSGSAPWPGSPRRRDARTVALQ